MMPIIIVLLGVMAVLITIVSFNRQHDSLYTEKLSMAEKYLDEKDYANAILYFEEVIALNDTDVDAYLGLAEAYYLSGQKDEAIRTLEKGYDKTRSDRIKERLEQYRKGYSSESGEFSQESKETDAQNDQFTLNDSLFHMFATYYYEDYCNRFSVEKVSTTTDGDVVIRFLHMNVDFYFNDTSDRKMISTTDGMPTKDAFPIKIVSNGLDQIASGKTDHITADDIRANSGVSNLTTETDSDFQSKVISFRYYSCLVKLVCDDSGIVTDQMTPNAIIPDMPKQTNQESSQTSLTESSVESSVESSLESSAESGLESSVESSVPSPPPPRPQPQPQPSQSTQESSEPSTEVQTYAYHGTVKDAVSNEPVTETVNVSVSSGSTVIASTTTSDGSFTLNLPAGSYQMSLSADGYVSDHYDIYVQEGENENNFMMSRVIATGTMRIVLTWGSVPRDLDGHLTGTNSSGNSVHVYFGSSIGADHCASLDVDDVSGNGCETITINDIGGTYQYKVHRYSSDGAIGTSGVVIKVYSADGSVKTITPPADVDDVSWIVFNVENGTVTDINGTVN